MTAIRFIGGFFIVMGLLFGLAGLGTAQSAFGMVGHGRTTGVILLSERGERPVIGFRDRDGRSVFFRSRVAAPRLKLADRVPVLYPTDDPNDARIDDPRWGVVLVLAAITIGLVAGGVALIRWEVRDLRRLRALRQNGRVLTLPVREVVLHEREEGERRQSYWRIIAQDYDAAADSYAVYQSELLDFDPRGTVRPGDPVTIRVDPADPTRYWMKTPKQSVRT